VRQNWHGCREISQYRAPFLSREVKDVRSS
jgi:hypothetical protein